MVTNSMSPYFTSGILYITILMVLVEFDGKVSILTGEWLINAEDTIKP